MNWYEINIILFLKRCGIWILKHRICNGTLGIPILGVDKITKEYKIKVTIKDIDSYDDYDNYFTDYYEDKNKYLEEII